MNCTEINEQSPLYLSGELDAFHAGRFAEHLRMCTSCARQIEQQQQMDARLKDAMLADSADSSAVESRVLSAISAGDVSAPRKYTWQIAIAAAILLLIAGGIGYRALVSSRVPQVYADAADDHQDEVVAKQPRRWRSDRAEIEALAARQKVPMAAVDALAANGYQLEKAKICSLDSRAYLHLVYASDGQEYSVFLRNSDATNAAGQPREVVNGVPIYESNRGDAHVAGFQSHAVAGLIVTDATADAALRAAEIASRGL